MSEIKVRINGRGNAWPVILGQESPFYNRNNIEDLANASCSILKSTSLRPKESEIEWDLMIDAGHGAVQYLLKNCNRIPEAVFITHPHIDHTLGLDWIVQSYYKQNKIRYPVYATVLCWEKIKALFPQLIDLVEFKELMPYRQRAVEEAGNVQITPYPAYHGKSADGATMLLFTIREDDKKVTILFTGDILCPLLREKDYATLSSINLLVSDANNRFPYPKSNHWSIVDGVNNEPSKYLKEFMEQSTIGTLLYPHLKFKVSNSYSRCFDYFLNEEFQPGRFFFTIQSFIEAINPQKIALLHYSGSEDQKYYSKSILNDKELEGWINTAFASTSFRDKFLVPYVSQHIDLISST